jgi:hypothetical protein
MPFCPTCRSEYRAGFERCADCGAALVDALPPRAPVGASIQEVAVATYPTRGEAEQWARFLETAGIQAVVAILPPGGTYPFEQLMPPHALRVRAHDATRARQLLEVQDEASARVGD